MTLPKIERQHLTLRTRIKRLARKTICFSKNISNWRRDKGKSYYEYVDKIADRLGVSIDYLIRGHEIKSDSLTRQETELMDNYRKLTDEGRKIISANVKLLSEK